MKAKKLFSLGLGLALMLSLFSACGRSDSEGDRDGDILSLSELSEYDNAANVPAYDGRGGSDSGDYGSVDFAGAADFYGTWESTIEDRWLVIYSDGSWTQYYEDGSYDIGSYYIDSGELCFDILGDRYFAKANGNIESVYGEEMFPSEVPQHILEGYSTHSYVDDTYYASDPGDGGYNPYGSDPGDGGHNPYGSDPGDGGYNPYGSDPGDYGVGDYFGGVGEADYYGTWERSDGEVWYTIYSDGDYKLIFFDGDFFHGSYWMDGYQLVLDNGMTLDLYQGNVVDSEGYMYYPSVEP